MNMNRKTSFADAFWGPDIQSSAGYDALKKLLKEGKQTSLAFEQFLRLRAKAEEEYGKGLQKACKATPETQESGSLRLAWDALREQSERIAQVHIEAGAQLNDAATRLTEFSRRQKSERVPRETTLLQSAREKVSCYRKTLELKRSYESKSAEAEQAENVMKKAKLNENAVSTKDWDKLVQKQLKSYQESQKADHQYAEAVIRLEQVRLQWEKDMTQFCTLCETLEDARIRMVQNEMWICCNIISTNCVEEDRCCESVRKCLENVSAESDIQSFIKTAGTGTEKPAPVKFEQYQSLLIGGAGLNPPMSNINRLSNHVQGNLPPVPDGRFQLPPYPGSNNH